MNILFLATNYPYPPDTGHNLRTFNILKSLAQKHRVFFIGFTKNMSRVYSDDPMHKLCTQVHIFTAPDDASWLRKMVSLFLNVFSLSPYIAEKYIICEVVNKIKEIINQHEIDLVHFDILHLARYSEIIGSLPKVLTEHNVESERFRRLGRNSQNPFVKLYAYLQYKKLYKFEKEACSLFDACIAVSVHDREVLQKMSPGTRFVVLPNGVDTTYFAPSHEEMHQRSIVWTGGMSDFYNREAMEYFCREIFPIIQVKIPELTVFVIGSDPPDSLVQLAKRFRGINILGYVDDIRPIVQASAVFIAPMLSGGGTKLKVLNAMSMGKVVVTTPVGAEGIEAEHGKEIIIADDSRSFANAVIDLLNEPNRVKRIGIRARKIIMNKYDWEKIGHLQNILYLEFEANSKELSAIPG